MRQQNLQVFVLGPPVQGSREVLQIVQDVVRRVTGQRDLVMGFTTCETPLLYMAEWFSWGNRKALRPSMASMELWSFSTKLSHYRVQSFSILIMKCLMIKRPEEEAARQAE